jgi:hypothetical protein
MAVVYLILTYFFIKFVEEDGCKGNLVFYVHLYASLTFERTLVSRLVVTLMSLGESV